MELKEFYLSKLTVWNQLKSFKGSTGIKLVQRKRDEIFVELNLVSWFNISESHRNQQFIEMRKQYKKIEMHELLHGNEQIMTVSGLDSDDGLKKLSRVLSCLQFLLKPCVVVKRTIYESTLLGVKVS